MPAKAVIKKVGSDGRRYFSTEHREAVLAAYDAEKARDPSYTHREHAEKHDVHKTLISNWLARREVERAKQAAIAKRAATRAANKANGAASSEKTQLSRPEPPASEPPRRGRPPNSVAAATKPRGGRSFETVSLELAGAIAKVSELKRELRALLGDE